MGGSPVLACAAGGSLFEVAFLDRTGEQCREPLPSCWEMPFECVGPSRSFPSFKGQQNFPGLWWSATTGEHVGYESWVERDVAMLLGFDPEVVAFSSQPFWLIWSGQQGERRHAPDFFARRADGTGVAAVLPVLYHLLWRQVLAADLAAAPLSPSSLVHLAEKLPR